MLSCYGFARKKSKKDNHRLAYSQNPTVTTSTEIKDIRVDKNSAKTCVSRDDSSRTLWNKFRDKDKESFKIQTRTSMEKNILSNNSSRSGSMNHFDQQEMDNLYRSASHPMSASSPLSGLPEFSHLGWGHWFTLRDLENATNKFSKDNVIGEGGYGIVYRGHLVNGSLVAIKKILDNV